MIYFFDESGIDLKSAPCSVLAGIAVSEDILWKFITEAIALKKSILALKTLHEWEPKGKKLLKRKKIRLSKQSPMIDAKQRSRLLRSLYEKNEKKINPTKHELTAIGQASVIYVEKILELCKHYDIKVFASVVPRESINTKGSELRKDYSYLFQRIYLHLISISNTEKGIIVFDETEKNLSDILIKQMRRYFLNTYKGQERSQRIIPEPFFVHSDLSTATQAADVIAYIINYGYKKFAIENIVTDHSSKEEKIHTFDREPPIREELEYLGEKVFDLQFSGIGQDHNKKPRKHFGIVYIKDLRTRFEKLGRNADDL